MKQRHSGAETEQVNRTDTRCASAAHFRRYMALQGMRSASKTIAKYARWARPGSTFRSELCSQGPLERVGSFHEGAASGAAVWAAHHQGPAHIAVSCKLGRGWSRSKVSAQFAYFSAATTTVDGLQAAPLFGAMPLAVGHCSARHVRRAVPGARALRPASYNWSAHSDAQQQKAASPQVLRSGGLQR